MRCPRRLGAPLPPARPSPQHPPPPSWPLRQQVRDAGNLLTRAQLALPTVDVDEFVMRYASPLDLVAHLRAMGESNALL